MDKINKIKQELEIKTSEDLFGIDPQPEQQCPKVDEHLRINNVTIKWIEGYIKDIKGTEDLDDIYKCADDIEWEVDNLNAEPSLEELRLKCDMIRQWGQQWKDLAKKLINEREDFIDLVGDNQYSKLEALTEPCL